MAKTNKDKEREEQHGIRIRVFEIDELPGYCSAVEVYRPSRDSLDPYGYDQYKVESRFVFDHEEFEDYFVLYENLAKNRRFIGCDWFTRSLIVYRLLHNNFIIVKNNNLF